MFSHSPFINCPNCNETYFGISTINDNKYYRRCKLCDYPVNSQKSCSFNLPPLTKKVIYLDQFVVSKFLFLLNKEMPQYQRLKEDKHYKFWFELYSKIDELVKMQLIICPESTSHSHESAMSDYYYLIKKIYERLSYNSSFKNFHDTKKHQTYKVATLWNRNENFQRYEFCSKDIFHNYINKWHDKFYFTFPRKYIADSKNEYKSTRDKESSILKNSFDRWKKEKNKTFYDWFNAEASSYGTTTISMYYNHLLNLEKISNGKVKPTFENISGPLVVDIFDAARLSFESDGLAKSESAIKSMHFFQSDAVKYIPFVRISSMLLASLARRANAGQKKYPTEGMFQDIHTLEIVTPYCDAIFIDNECNDLLNEKPLKTELNYDTKIFSLKNKDEFIEYLDIIKSSASQEHLNALEEVYGKDGCKPNFNIFK